LQPLASVASHAAWSMAKVVVLEELEYSQDQVNTVVELLPNP
jgi:hypothetical protein